MDEALERAQKAYIKRNKDKGINRHTLSYHDDDHAHMKREAAKSRAGKLKRGK